MSKRGKIDGNVERFREIIRGKVRADIFKHIANGDFIVPPGEKGAAIPLPKTIVLPRFHFGDNGGVSEGPGQGEEGDEGDELNNDETEHQRSIEMPVSEIVDILGESLELPYLVPKTPLIGEEQKIKYNSRSLHGPRALLHKKETLKRTILRTIASGTYDPENPKLIMLPTDQRFRSWKTKPTTDSKAVIFFIADISGSIDQKIWEIIIIESYWIEQWIKKFYPKTAVTKFIIHDDKAREATREEFFTMLPGSSTLFAPAYRLANDIIIKDYPPKLWNIYLFHWTDGDGLAKDEREAVDIAENQLLPMVNLFGLEQIQMKVKNGELSSLFSKLRKNRPALKLKMRLSSITSKVKIPRSLRTLLGKQ